MVQRDAAFLDLNRVKAACSMADMMLLNGQCMSAVTPAGQRKEL